MAQEISKTKVKRSKDMVLAGYFLARCNMKDEQSDFFLPPPQINTVHWKDAYQIFFPSLGSGRTEKEFHNSLKNIRDSFDSHFQTSRVGWRNLKDKNGSRSPRNLTSDEHEIWEEWQNRSDAELWNEVRRLIFKELKKESAEPEPELIQIIQKNSRKNILFNQIFQDFRKIVAKEDGSDEISFVKEGFLKNWEDYKKELRDKAFSVLQDHTWSENDVGSGKILENTIKAIEYNDGSLKNNLVRWQEVHGPGSASHHKLKSARTDPKLRSETERLLFDLYRKQGNDGKIFDRLVSLIGKRYDVIAYLFFLKSREKYLPISPENFDNIFSLLGFTLKTSGNCSWENYEDYLSIIRWLKEQLIHHGLHDVQLIDAHSFCWVLAKKHPLIHHEEPDIPFVRLQPDSDGVLPLKKGKSKKPGSSSPRDFVNEERENEYIGRISEEHVLNHERKRLKKAGFPDLAEKVILVSDNYALGYDIQSYNTDGSQRHIEVKTARVSGKIVSFHMSENQRETSQSDKNYFVYVVKNPETRPKIGCIIGKQIKPEYLTPEQYLVQIPVRDF